MSGIKILHISTSDFNGGAAKAAYKIHKGLLQQGNQSKMLVLNKTLEDPDIINYTIFKNTSQILLWYKYLILNRISKWFLKFKAESNSGEIYSLYLHPYEYPRLDFKPDIIILHWISGFININSILKYYDNKIPIIWRLPDLNPITGGCHYSFGCEKFKKGCNKCPELTSNFKFDVSYFGFKYKRKFFREVSKNKFCLVALSTWMESNFQNNELLKGVESMIIPNGVELNKFRKLSSNEIQDKKLRIGLDPSLKYFLLIADDLRNKRKGLEIAIEAINHASINNSFGVILVGDIESSLAEKIIALDVKVIHKTASKAILNKIYNVSDFFLYTSLEENFANTALESMATGTPVIGFDSGGIVDIVVNGENGFLTPYRNREMLAELIEGSLKLTEEKLNEIQLNSIKKVENRFSMNECIISYEKLIKKIINYD